MVSKDWITMVFMIIFGLLVLAKLFFPQRFQDFLKLLVSNRYFDFKRGNFQTDYFSIFLFLANILSISLLIFIIWKHFSPEKITDPKILFVQIALAYCMFFTIKYFLEKIIADLFQIDKMMTRYVWYKISFRNFLSLLLLLPSLFFIYGHPASTTEIVVLSCMVGGFNIVVLANFYRKNQPYILPQWFYFILYLCALEIGPYFILYKVIGS